MADWCHSCFCGPSELFFLGLPSGDNRPRALRCGYMFQPVWQGRRLDPLGCLGWLLENRHLYRDLTHENELGSVSRQVWWVLAVCTQTLEREETSGCARGSVSVS